SNAFPCPSQYQMSALNPSGSATQTAVQMAASFVLGACALCWKPNRSMASTQSTPQLKAIQNQRFVCMKTSDPARADNWAISPPRRTQAGDLVGRSTAPLGCHGQVKRGQTEWRDNREQALSWPSQLVSVRTRLECARSKIPPVSCEFASMAGNDALD